MRAARSMGVTRSPTQWMAWLSRTKLRMVPTAPTKSTRSTGRRPRHAGTSVLVCSDCAKARRRRRRGVRRTTGPSHGATALASPLSRQSCGKTATMGKRWRWVILSIHVRSRATTLTRATRYARSPVVCGQVDLCARSNLLRRCHPGYLRHAKRLRSPVFDRLAGKRGDGLKSVNVPPSSASIDTLFACPPDTPARRGRR